ncbi:MAG: class I SAM-dependent methyltransferase [Promethearchaeota archaeon]
MKERTLIIQKIINQKKANNYLEIGINWGINFLNIICPRKMGVDPRMRITPRKKIYSYFKNFSNLFNCFYHYTSDQFFEKNEQLLRKIGLDVVFIDGLHTYHQSLQDVLNSLKFLNKHGIIILHDVNPPNKKSTQIRWLGDTWKTILHMRSLKKDLKIFVLDIETGLGIITRGKSNKILELNFSQIEELSYNELEKNRINLLNVKNYSYFQKFLESLKKSSQMSTFSTFFYTFFLKILFKIKLLKKIYKSFP